MSFKISDYVPKGMWNEDFGDKEKREFMHLIKSVNFLFTKTCVIQLNMILEIKNYMEIKKPTRKWAQRE